MGSLSSAPWRAVARLGVLATLAVPGTAQSASEIIDSAFSDCKAVNCSATSIAAYVGSYKASPQPWVVKILAVKGMCLRLQTTFVRTPTPLEMIVIAPDPTRRWRNVGANLPAVRISPTPQSGFYTVIVSPAKGEPINTDFHLLFGQYTPGNPNCAAPTPVIK